MTDKKGYAYFRRNRQGSTQGLDTYVKDDWKTNPVPFTMNRTKAEQLTQAEFEAVKERFARHDWTWAWAGEVSSGETLACVNDRRHGWIGSWETEPLVLAEMTEEDVGRTVIYVDESKSFMRRAEVGTITSISYLTGTVFVRYDTGDTSQATPAARLCFGLRPLDGDLSR